MLRGVGFLRRVIGLARICQEFEEWKSKMIDKQVSKIYK